VGVLVQDASGRLTHANPAAMELLEMSTQQLDDASVMNGGLLLTAPDGKPLDEAAYPFVRALNDGRPLSGVPYGVTVASGRRLVISANVVPVFGDDGELNAVVTAFRDRDETAELEERLQRCADEAQQLAYAVSHDLQEPLRMVASYLQLVARRYRGQLDADADDFIDFAVDGANRMQEMLRALLAYTRVHTRGRPFRAVELGEVLREVNGHLEAERERTGATLEYTDAPVVDGDEQQLTWVLRHLVENAIKFARPDTPPRIQVDFEARHDEWLVSVHDNGIGIAPEHHERPFRLFQRLHERSAHPGPGAGLAICRRIIERHCGRIWLSSARTAGTTVLFTLPRSNASR